MTSVGGESKDEQSIYMENYKNYYEKSIHPK